MQAIQQLNFFGQEHCVPSIRFLTVASEVRNALVVHLEGAWIEILCLHEGR
jgi:hypothetical protein